MVQDIIVRMREFVDQVYVPDTLAIAGFYKDWATQGEGLGNFYAYGDFPAKGIDDPSTFLMPRGVILDRDLSTIHRGGPARPTTRSRNSSHTPGTTTAGGKDAGPAPVRRARPKLNYTGPKPPYQHLDVEQSYSWLKSPRWKGKAMEVGPLARMLMLYANGHAQAKELVGHAR